MIVDDNRRLQAYRRPTTCSVSTFAGKKKGFPFRNPPNLKKMIKGQENHFADWIVSFGLKGGALYIYAVKFASLPIVLRECGARHRRIR